MNHEKYNNNHPFGAGNPANLSSLSYKTQLHSAKNYTTTFASHYDLHSRTPFAMDYSWVHLQDSDDCTQKWLAMTGSEFFFTPVGSNQPVARSVESGAIVIVRRNEDGTWTCSVPHSKLVPATDDAPPVIPDDEDSGKRRRYEHQHNLDPVEDEEFHGPDTYPDGEEEE